MTWLPTDFIENFHFVRPWFLLGLLVIFLLIYILHYLQHNQSSWKHAISADLLPFLLDKDKASSQRYPLFGLLFIWALSCIALAGPVWQQIPVPVQEKEDAMVIILDMSLSMYSNDLSPNRLVRAQRKLIDTLNMRNDEGQTALVVYAGDAHTVTPLTDDVGTINSMVSSLTPDIMPVLGSKPQTGISLALELLDNSAINNAQLLLITDGINRSDIGPIQRLLEDTQYTLLILGVATDIGAPVPMAEGGFLRDQKNAIVIPKLNAPLLTELASAVNGHYKEIQLGDQDIEALLNQGSFTNEDLIESEREFDSWSEAGPWLLLLVLPFAALAFRRGWLLGLSFVFISFPDQQAYAWEWQQLWSNADQRGSQTFADENYQQAAQLFEDGAWRAAANYRSGNYEQAVADLSPLTDPNSRYNLGNSLAHLNKFEEAIAAYDEVLVQQPEHAEAQYNKGIIEKLLEQQEQEQQDQEGESGEDQEQQQQDGDQEQNSDEQEESEQSGDQEEQEEGETDDPNESEQDTEQEEGENQQNETEQNSEQSPPPNSEEEQALQQWLNRVKDDPGELLRNKFKYQSQRQLYKQLQNPNLSKQEAGQQIW